MNRIKYYNTMRLVINALLLFSMGFCIATAEYSQFIPPQSPLSRTYFRTLHRFRPVRASHAPFSVPIHRAQPSPEATSTSESSAEINNRRFSTNSYFDISDKPVLANGHIAYIPYGDSIYMNGLYNGYKGGSHRARIPNYANIQFENCSSLDLHKSKCTFELDIDRGVFRTTAKLNNGNLEIEQTQYAHRYYDEVIVNSIQLKRNASNTSETVTVQLYQSWEPWSEDLQIESINILKLSNREVVLLKASTKISEDPAYQKHMSEVIIAHEIIPNNIKILKGETSTNFTWITIVKSKVDGIENLFLKTHENSESLFKLHTDEWKKFWQENSISVNGNDELSKSIQASLFAMAASLPSLNTFHSRDAFYGLSPSGLGLGGPKLDGYQGHSFWDTEIWMHPPILLLEPKWSRELLNYRYIVRESAYHNAQNTGYKGLRFPWESAYTGRDVTLAAYPNIVEFEQHITADIGHAVRQHFFATHDLIWLRQVGCELAYGTSQFWESRVTFNSSTNRYDINGVMGPDEDHYNINNNAYTNVAAALNLYFGSYASCICNKFDATKYPINTNWSSIASHITLLYDSHNDYNPQYDGYNLSIGIKQADVVLLGYPLQYANVQKTTRKNNLILYENVTRSNGPAMTWSMDAIGYLDVNILPTEQLFNRTFIPYIRKPFYVWNEYVVGVKDGASNFITGAGGFLQLIMYGYAGIRINADSLTVKNPVLPPKINKLKLNGISYMQSRLSLEIRKDIYIVTMRMNRHDVRIYIDDAEQDTATKNIFELNREQKLIVKPKEMVYLDACAYPEDIIDQITII